MANKIPCSYGPSGPDESESDKDEEKSNEGTLVVAPAPQKHVAYVFYYYHSGSGRRSEWMVLSKDTMQCNFRSVLVSN